MTKTNITNDQAVGMKDKAIARAVELELVRKAKFLIESDPRIPDGIQRSTALPGSGLLIKLSKTSEAQFTVEIVSADNPTARVFWYKRDYSNETYVVFRDGSWVEVLNGFYKKLRFELEHSFVLEIIKNFAPIEEPKEG
jgi:hypothetical protein